MSLTRSSATLVMGHEPGEDINLSYIPSVAELTRRRILERDGSSLLRADYPGLFGKIGVMYGSTDGIHFSLPDDRGQFLRILDHGADVDPNRTTRLNRGDGVAGDNVGTLQNDMVISHRHTIRSVSTVGSGSSIGLSHILNGAPYGNIPNDCMDAGGLETRPKNRNKWGGIFY